MNYANYREEIYYRYQNIREVAKSVYAKKLKENEVNGYPLTFNEICSIIVFDFDDHNQAKVAKALGVEVNQMLRDLVGFTVGIQLQGQGK